MIENFVIDTIICVIVYQISKRGFQNKDDNGYEWVFHGVRWGKKGRSKGGLEEGMIQNATSHNIIALLELYVFLFEDFLNY